HTRSKRDWSSDVCSSDLDSMTTPWRKMYSTDPSVVIRTEYFLSVFPWWCGRHRGWVFRKVVVPPRSGFSWSKGMRWSTSDVAARRMHPGTLHDCHLAASGSRTLAGM